MVYVLRHGTASRPDPNGPRSLTSHGREEVAKVAQHFKKKGLKVQTLWHSPKTRALQTAEIFLEVVGKAGIEVEEKKGLKPEGKAQEVFEEICAEKTDALLLVSHLPFVAELAAFLSGGDPDAQVTFPTAGLAAFERKGKTWKWLWSLDPSTLKG